MSEAPPEPSLADVEESFLTLAEMEAAFADADLGEPTENHPDDGS